MSIAQSLFLGILQGLTEFLPVSSSGHLVIAQHFFNLDTPPLLFDILLHIGTLGAVIVYFWKTFLKTDRHQLKNIILATIPAVIVGVLLTPYLPAIFDSLFAVGLGLVCTALLLFASLKAKDRGTILSTTTSRQSFIIGSSQALALFPGVSRSGTTVVTGMMLGLTKKTAFGFSFLIAIPATIGALILQLTDITPNQIELTPMVIGFFAAMFVGLLALRMLDVVISKTKLHYFGIYCLILGIGILLTQTNVF